MIVSRENHNCYVDLAEFSCYWTATNYELSICTIIEKILNVAKTVYRNTDIKVYSSFNLKWINHAYSTSFKGKTVGCVPLWFNEVGDWHTAQLHKIALTAQRVLTSFTSKDEDGRHQLLPTLFYLSVNGGGYWRTMNTFLFPSSFIKRFLSAPLSLGKLQSQFLELTSVLTVRRKTKLSDLSKFKVHGIYWLIF